MIPLRRIVGLVMALCVILLPSPEVNARQGRVLEDVIHPEVTLEKSVVPTRVLPGGSVRYTILLSNHGDVAATGVMVEDVLPAGFTYRPGTSRLYDNGLLIASADPALSGRKLTWSGLTVPAGRSDSYFGVNTFIQDRCSDSNILFFHLDQASRLIGGGGWVKQLLPGIDLSWQEAPPCYKDFVIEAYRRHLKPVIRVAGHHAGSYWQKPPAEGPYNYRSYAAAIARVIHSLPKQDGHTLYVQVWNEPNLDVEWGLQPHAGEYATFLSQVYDAIKAYGDPRVVVLNAPMSPGASILPGTFIDSMFRDVPASLWKWDVWGSHAYPGNHPPEYNIHQNTAQYDWNTIDSYRQELAIINRHGRQGVKVFISETGHNLGNNAFAFEGYPPIGESNRADYIQRSFRNYWSEWPEVIGVAPFELNDPLQRPVWLPWDWVYSSGAPHLQYDAVRALDKTAVRIPSTLTLTFDVDVPDESSTYYNDVRATADNTTIEPRLGVAPVVVGFPTSTPTPDSPPTQTPTPPPTPQAAIVGTWPVGQRPHGIAIDPGSDRVFVGHHTGYALKMLNGSSGALIKDLSTDGALGANGVVYDPTHRRVFAAFKQTGVVVAIDVDDPSQRMHIPVGDQPNGIALDPEAGRLFVANFASHSLSIIDAGGLSEIRRVPTLASPSHLAFDPITGHVFLTQHHAHAVREYDHQGELIRTWTFANTGPYGITLDREGRRLFIANRLDNSITRLHLESGYHVRLPMPCSTRLVSYNKNTGRLWAVCDVTRHLYLLDPQTGQSLQTFSLGADPGEGIAINQATNRIYVSNAGDNTLSVFSEQGPVTEPTPAPTPTITPQRQRLHLPMLWHMNLHADPGRSITPMPAQSPLLPLDHLVAMPRAIAIDPNSGEIATAEANVLVIRDAGGAERLRMPIGQAPVALQYDGEGLLYLSDRDLGQVWAIDGEEGRVVHRSPQLGQPTGLLWLGDRILVADTLGDRLVMLDRQLRPLTIIPSGRSPYALAAKAGMVAVAHAGSDTVEVRTRPDMTYLHSISLSGLGHPQDLDFEASTGRLYVLFVYTPRLHRVAEIDPERGELRRLIGGDLVYPLVEAHSLLVDDGMIILPEGEGISRYDLRRNIWLSPAHPGAITTSFGLARARNGDILLAPLFTIEDEILRMPSEHLFDRRTSP